MPIQIIDNFELGASKPIDNRFVVGAVDSFYADKNDIPYKYTGLRVWDLSGGAPGVGYVWDGSAWQGEAGGSVTSTGSAGYVSKFLATPTTIDDSIIYETAVPAKIGIATTTPDKTLTVNGAIKTIGTPPNGGFYGNGANITNINASNITTGNLSVNRISPGTLNFILTTGGSGTEWTDPSTITVGKATDADKVYYQTSSSSNFLPIMFSESTGASGYHALRQSLANLAIKPSDGSIRMSLGTGNATIGHTTPSTTYKLYIRTTTNYGLLVDKNGVNGARVYLNGPVGANTVPSTGSYGLMVGGGSTWPLFVYKVSNRSAYFQGNIGIGTSPSTNSDRKIAISGGSSQPNIDGIIYADEDVKTTKTLSTGTHGTNGAVLRLRSRNGQGGSANTYFYRNDDDYTTIRVDTNTSTPNWTGGFYFYENGTAAKSGGGSWTAASDVRLKKDIKPITSALDKIKKLNGVSFSWKSNNEKSSGFIADDVEKHFPHWVQSKKANPIDKEVVKDEFIKLLELPFEWNALVVEAIKELADRISKLED